MNKPLMAMMCLTLLVCQKVRIIQAETPLNERQRIEIIQNEWSGHKIAAKAMPLPVKNPAVSVSVPEIRLPKEFQEKISLQAKDLDLSDLMKTIGRVVHYNPILGPGVEDKKLSLDVHDVTIEKVLNTVLFPIGYGFKAHQGDLIILAQETRIFRIVLPPTTVKFNDTTSNESSIQSQGSNEQNKGTTNQQVKVGTKILVENASSGISFWDDVSLNIRTLLSAKGRFSLNKPAGVVIVTDTPAALERITSYFTDLNQRVTQQIEVDVKVVEVAFNQENRLGIDWNVLVKNLKELNGLGLESNFGSGNFTNGNFFKFLADGPKPGSGVSTSGIKFVLDALSKQGKVEVVSQPRVVILNNQVAVIQVGSTQSFVDHSSVETTSTGTITSLSTSQVQEGVTMRLLGNIVDSQIYLSVTPVVTTIDNIRSITSGNTKIEAPQTTTKSINTLVKLQQGETVAIGGLITSLKQKNKEGVPILSKVPLLGKLFEYNQDKNTRSELIIFITPKKV